MTDSNQHCHLFRASGKAYRYDVKTYDGEDFVDAEAHTALIARYNGLIEQLETLRVALEQIVHLPDETKAYSYADACVQIASTALMRVSSPLDDTSSPASEPKEDAP